jgi:hypothetical protein
MEVTRVLEVLHDRGEHVVPRWLLGSGFLVRAGVVLTAAHNLGDSLNVPGPHGTTVRTIDGSEHRATLLARCDEVDLALLATPALQAQAVRLARVERTNIAVVRGVVAVGFPNFKYADDRPAALRRQPAQPIGHIPTAEGQTAGDLTLKIEGGLPAPPPAGVGSPWQGLSGAGVFVEELLLGIVTEHHTAEGLGSLRVRPLACLLDLPEPQGMLFKAILDLNDPLAIVLVGGEPEPDKADPVLAGIVQELHQLMNLGGQGLLRVHQEINEVL